MISRKAPVKAFRKGITLMELADMFPDEESALRWFEERFWPNGRTCGHCGSTNTREASHAKMPYWCSDCRSYFSIKTGTLLEYTQLPLRKWVFAIHLHLTSSKGISSMKLHRDIGVAQKTAWHMLQRIRKAFDDSDDDGPFDGPVEVDESYFGGKRANMSNARRREQTGRGPAGKTAVVGIMDDNATMSAAEVRRVVDEVIEECAAQQENHADNVLVILTRMEQTTGTLVDTAGKMELPVRALRSDVQELIRLHQKFRKAIL